MYPPDRLSQKVTDAQNRELREIALRRVRNGIRDDDFGERTVGKSINSGWGKHRVRRAFGIRYRFRFRSYTTGKTPTFQTLVE